MARNMPEQRLMERIAKVLSSGNFSMGCGGGRIWKDYPSRLGTRSLRFSPQLRNRHRNRPVRHRARLRQRPRGRKGQAFSAMKCVNEEFPGRVL